METFGVVVNAPFLNDHLSFLEAVEDFAIETFIHDILSVAPPVCGHTPQRYGVVIDALIFGYHYTPRLCVGGV